MGLVPQKLSLFLSWLYGVARKISLKDHQLVWSLLSDDLQCHSKKCILLPTELFGVIITSLNVMSNFHKQLQLLKWSHSANGNVKTRALDKTEYLVIFRDNFC